MSRLITGSRSSAYVGGKLVDIGTSAVYQLQLNRNIIGKRLRHWFSSVCTNTSSLHRLLRFYFAASDKNAVTTTLTEETNVIIVLSPTHFSAEVSSNTSQCKTVLKAYTIHCMPVSTTSTIKVLLCGWQESLVLLCLSKHISDMAHRLSLHTLWTMQLQLLASSAFLTVLIGEGWVRSVPVPSGESTLICNGP